MVDDPLLKVFDGSGGEEAVIGDELSAVEVVEEEAPKMAVVLEEEPSSEEKVVKKKAIKKTTRRKSTSKPKKIVELLADGRSFTGREIVTKCKCTISDVREVCASGEITSVYEKCCESGTFQFKYKLA
jgi:hypothetical protein